MTARETFRRGEHIRRRPDFEHAYRSGVKISGRFMTVFVGETKSGIARLGIAATRKIGNAVIRNRAKRLTRELFRKERPPVAVDVVVVPRREFLDAPYSSLEQEFRALVNRALRTSHRTESGRPDSPGAHPRV